MPTPTDIRVNDLKINVLTEQQYSQIQNPSNTELYLVPESVDTTPTQGSTNAITSGGVYNALANSLYEDITYSDIRTKISNSQLVKGKMYRIVDYDTRTTQSNTNSAGHGFDLVVTAISTNELDHRASALERSGDTYFSNAGSDLTKWKIWYDVYNDDTKYRWADTNDGKGVIYRMIDEYGNECPYDFKNIVFTDTSTFGEKIYTFNFNDSGVNEDHSLNGRYCFNNVIKKRADGLNFTVFLNRTDTSRCFDNRFGIDCGGNVFGDSCFQIEFGNNCSSNNFRGTCDHIHFGDDCEKNIFALGCSDISFGDFCSDNNLASNCTDIELGFDCNHILLSTTFCKNIRIGNYNNYIRLYNSDAASFNNQLSNVYIVQGFNNSSNNTYTDISTITRGRGYRTTVGRKSDGSVKIYNEEDCVADYALTAAQVEHVLHIGPHDYNGSADVTVDIYDSDYYFASDFGYFTDVLFCYNTGVSVNQTTGNSEYTLDHTPQEIYDAILDKKLVVVILNHTDVYYINYIRNILRIEFTSYSITDDLSFLHYNNSGNNQNSLSAPWVFLQKKPFVDFILNPGQINNTVDLDSLFTDNGVSENRVACINNSSSTITVSLSSTLPIYISNSSDLTIPANKRKVLYITRILYTNGFQGYYVFVQPMTLYT